MRGSHVLGGGRSVIPAVGRPLLVALIVAMLAAALVPFFGTNGSGASGGLAVEQSTMPSAGRASGLHVVPPAPLTSRNTVLAFPPPPIMARAAYLVDMESGKVLYQKNANARLP